jgi:hypothetical protein
MPCTGFQYTNDDLRKEIDFPNGGAKWFACAARKVRPRSQVAVAARRWLRLGKRHLVIAWRLPPA